MRMRLILMAAGLSRIASFLLKDTYALTVEAFVDFGQRNTFTCLFDFGAQNQALQGRNYVFSLLREPATSPGLKPAKRIPVHQAHK